jgi:hypothetical protein
MRLGINILIIAGIGKRLQAGVSVHDSGSKVILELRNPEP